LCLEEAMAYCEAALGPLKQALVNKSNEERIDTSRSSDFLRSRMSEPSILLNNSISEPLKDSSKGEAVLLPRAKSDPVGETRRDSASSARSSSQGRVWEDKASRCTICDVRLGKRFLKPRHHCRICGKSVCSSCSPSSVYFEGEKNLQRTCTPCVSSVQQVPALKRRVSQLAERLSVISGGSSRPGGEIQAPEDLEQAVSKCESVLEDMQAQGTSQQALAHPVLRRPSLSGRIL